MKCPDISKAVTALIEGSSWQPQHTNRASSIGHPCARFLTYCRTHWEELGGVDIGLKGVFQTGNELEPVIERIISRAGQKDDPQWRIVGAQMPVVDELFRRYQITGTIDGILQVMFEGEWMNVAASDIKTCSPFTYDRFNDAEDLKRDDGHFGYKWWVQLQVYAFGLNLERCALIMVNKTNLFQIKIIEWEIDYALCEHVLQKAEAINAGVEAWRTRHDDERHPPKINRPKICVDCKVAHVCNPLIEFTEEAIFEDDEAESLIADKFLLDKPAKEHKATMEKLKKVLPKAPLLIVGPFVVKGTKRKDGAFVRTYSTRQESVSEAAPKGAGDE